MANWQHRIHTKQVTLTRFASQTLLLDSLGAMYFPEYNLLVVSDLHLEKGSYLKRFGIPLATYDSIDTLSRLAKLIEQYQPDTLVCLGDSFHDHGALARMNQNDLSVLDGLVRQVNQWIWVIGNHDPTIPEFMPGSKVGDVEVAGILLSHEYQPVRQQAQIIGHYHPKTTCKIKRHRITGKCFVASPTILIMPSFGSYTGGLNIDDDVIVNLIGGETIRRFLLYQDKIWPL